MVLLPRHFLFGGVAVAAEFLQATADVFFEAVDEGEGEGFRVERFVVDERSEVHGEGEGAGFVCGMGVEVGGVGAAEAFFGEVVAFAAADLGVEDGKQGADEVWVLVDPEHFFVLCEEPVEFSPDFAAVDFLWSDLFGELA